MELKKLTQNKIRNYSKMKILNPKPKISETKIPNPKTKIPKTKRREGTDFNTKESE